MPEEANPERLPGRGGAELPRTRKSRCHPGTCAHTGATLVTGGRGRQQSQRKKQKASPHLVCPNVGPWSHCPRQPQGGAPEPAQGSKALPALCAQCNCGGRSSSQVSKPNPPAASCCWASAAAPPGGQRADGHHPDLQERSTEQACRQLPEGAPDTKGGHMAAPGSGGQPSPALPLHGSRPSPALLLPGPGLAQLSEAQTQAAHRHWQQACHRSYLGVGVCPAGPQEWGHPPYPRSPHISLPSPWALAQNQAGGRTKREHLIILSLFSFLSSLMSLEEKHTPRPIGQRMAKVNPRGWQVLC